MRRKAAGFYLGDGTGVGKGRTIAAICYDRFLKHRGSFAELSECSSASSLSSSSSTLPSKDIHSKTKSQKGMAERGLPFRALWVSVSWDLAVDAGKQYFRVSPSPFSSFSISSRPFSYVLLYLLSFFVYFCNCSS